MILYILAILIVIPAGGYILSYFIAELYKIHGIKFFIFLISASMLIWSIHHVIGLSRNF